jgi:hypothetical protein
MLNTEIEDPHPGPLPAYREREKFELVSASMRLEFAKTEFGFGFQLFVGDKLSVWKSVSAPANPLVRGHCFDLLADEIEQRDASTLLLRGRKFGAGIDYPWSATVTARDDWFDFDITIDSPTPITLQHAKAIEPEIMLDLGDLPPYERGDHVWFMTNIANPTRWNDDAWGNDCPATYYFDPYKRFEIVMFFDMTAMDWMSFDNLARFCDCRCSLRRRYRGRPAAELGLHAVSYSGATFPAGPQKFAYSISARPREKGPTDHQAVCTMVERCLERLPKHSPWPRNATTWRDFSERCADELMHDGHCWRKKDGEEYLLNYVGAHSVIWTDALNARAVPFTFDQPCLESGVWTALPLATLRTLDRAPIFEHLYKRAAHFTLNTVRSGTSFIDKVESEDKALGTWQYVYILEQIFQLARFENDQKAIDHVLAEVNRFTIPLARKMSYLFPLSFGRLSMEKAGGGDAHSVACVYASLMLDLHEMNGEASYLVEAITAMRVVGRLPVNTITQELMLHAIGVQVAARLFAKTGDPFFAEQQRYLQAQVLRQQYWYQDRTTAQARRSNTLGSFMACGVINYPALFENIEAVARVAVGFKQQVPTANVLRVFEHARRNNFYFFPQVVDEIVTSPLPHVPYEGMAILEGPVASDVGQEIYGAGWTFRACLLWEAYCRCDDRDVMVMNLNSYEELELAKAGAPEYSFVVFNSTNDIRRVRLTLAEALRRSPAVAVGVEWARLASVEVDPDGSFAIEMLPDEVRLVRVAVPR